MCYNTYIAAVAEWQTRCLQAAVSSDVRVQLPPAAPNCILRWLILIMGIEYKHSYLDKVRGCTKDKHCAFLVQPLVLFIVIMAFTGNDIYDVFFFVIYNTVCSVNAAAP